MTLEAERKKKEQIQAKGEAAKAAEIEREKQRKIAARKAEAERQWTPNDLAELREEFLKFTTKKKSSSSMTIPSSAVKTICETLGETLTVGALQLLLTEMKPTSEDQIQWVGRRHSRGALWWTVGC